MARAIPPNPAPMTIAVGRDLEFKTSLASI